MLQLIVWSTAGDRRMEEDLCHGHQDIEGESPYLSAGFGHCRHQVKGQLLKMLRRHPAIVTSYKAAQGFLLPEPATLTLRVEKSKQLVVKGRDSLSFLLLFFLSFFLSLFILFSFFYCLSIFLFAFHFLTNFFSKNCMSEKHFLLFI